MAQIRLEEKKSGSILPWIIGLLLLALIIWGVAEAFDDDEIEETYTEEVIEDDDVAPVAPVANNVDYMTPIAAFMATTENMEGDMGLDHEFSHKALTELVDATVAVAQAKGVNTAATTQAKVDEVKQLADEITRDPMAGDHADKIKQAALLITDMLESIDQESYNSQASADISELRNEAQAISQETLTLNQKEDVRSFFGQAREVLQDMT
jgi:hypothetical protein